jgi:anti-anti-sigma regulatory factor
MMHVEQSPKVLVYRDGSRLHARILGPVNRETVSVFQQRLDAALNDAFFMLTLDLGAADYLDSDGIRWLQRLQAELHSRDIELRLAVREGSRSERTLQLLQLERAFSLDRYPVDHSPSVTVSAYK